MSHRHQTSRMAERGAVRTLEMVTVFRDRLGLSYDEAMQRVGMVSTIDRLFNAVAEIRDSSAGGVGLRISSQPIRARNLLRIGESYLLKLPLRSREGVPPSCLRPYQDFVVLKAVCCWRSRYGEASAAGFALRRADHPSGLLSFIQHYLSSGGHVPALGPAPAHA